jgi:disulfide bond formation protein DsbB
MRLPARNLFWLALGLGAAVLAGSSLVLTAWFDLNPCHLCIFQRLLFMVIAPLGLVAAFARSRVAAALIVPPALLGIGTAGYQSWLQLQPAVALSCVATDPSLIERLVEWLGERLPDMFLATGFCDDPALVILGLSLANWALLAFLICFAAAAWALFARPAPTPGDRS